LSVMIPICDLEGHFRKMGWITDVLIEVPMYFLGFWRRL